MSRSLGAIPFEIKKEDLGFPLAKAERKETIYRTYQIGGARDQGSSPQCVGYALAGLLAAEPIRQSPFSPKEIYLGARDLENTPKSLDGVKLTSGVDFLKKEGVVEKEFWSVKAEEIVGYVNSISPVVFSLFWTSRMDEPKSDGRVVMGGGYRGHHAVLAFRWDGLKERLWCQNNWGSAWGENGNFYVTLKDLGKLMNSGSIGCAIIEKKK